MGIMSIWAGTVPVAAAWSQDVKLISFPEVGVPNTIPAGGTIYSYVKMYAIPGARLDADTKAGDWLVERPVPAGTELVPVNTRAAFKACAPYPGSLEANGPCFLDDDGNGTFDRQARDNITIERKLKPPVPYSLVDVSVLRSDAFKRVILFQGANSDSLRFSYREFNDDMARPAFTEELTIPREPFPAMIMLKNLQIEVLGVSGMGLQYRLIKVD